jgi:hypothetical protein
MLSYAHNEFLLYSLQLDLSSRYFYATPTPRPKPRRPTNNTSIVAFPRDSHSQRSLPLYSASRCQKLVEILPALYYFDAIDLSLTLLLTSHHADSPRVICSTQLYNP